MVCGFLTITHYNILFSALISAVQLLIINSKNKLIELNKKLDPEIISFDYFKQSIEIIAYIMKILFKLDELEKHLANIQTSIVEHEA
ncbi:unnamed protein product, partial [Rotaria sp. Silwood1]